MITLQCPCCGKAVETDSVDTASSRCPYCNCSLAQPVREGETPVHATPPGSAAANVADTHALEQPTLVGGGSAAVGPPAFAFLAPPQQAGEMGWLGHYRVLKLLGHGGMGIVFQAEDTHLERLVALKVMNMEAARDSLARRRFLRAAKMMVAIRSDHIVTIHHVGIHKQLPFLAMELLHGETLAAWLQRGKRAAPAQVLDIALQVARGLEAAHNAGLIHRDIKPGNIWLDSAAARVKLLDFGLARPAEDGGKLTKVGMVVGTPAYMSPEQAEGKKLDFRSDLFSLGCVLYELAAGVPPFTGASAFAVLTAIVLRDPKPLGEVNPSLPPELAELVMRLLAKMVQDRPGSTSAIVTALEHIADVHPELHPSWTSGRRARWSHAPARRYRSRRWLAMTAGLGVLTGILALLFGLRGYFAPSEEPPFHPSPSAAHATAQGVTDNRILLGTSAPFTGPVGELGRSLYTGMQAWINQVNDAGGIAGRKLELIALDDGYDPDRALANVRELAEEYRVFAFIGNVGTPTAEKTLPYILQKRMLLFGAFTGAELLRPVPPNRYILNYCASLEEETAAAVHYVVEGRKVRPEQIAVFAQQDGYGDSGYRGVVRALRKYGRTPEQILRVGYRRNTSQVEYAAKQIVARKDIRAVIMVPTYRPAARFIGRIRDARKDVLFTCTSFVDSDSLAAELLEMGPEYADGVMVTQAVPPIDSHSSMVVKYRKTLRRFHPSKSPSSVSLEGYITAALLTAGLRQAGEELTTDSLIGALESMHDLDLGIGVRLGFTPSEHQASHKVWGIVLERSGRYRPVDVD
jgi:serine/threonine protein kinase/ABC-type branched-subunit amino acid transport system substrate-binding protein